MNQAAGRSGFEWANQTSLHPIGLAAILVLGVALWLLPRKYAILPMLIMACFVSSQQRIVVATLDFTLLRVLVLFGVTRIFMRREYAGFKANRLDLCMVVWATTLTAVYTINLGEVAALINRLGASFDALGMYFLFRIFIRSWDDIWSLARAVAVLSVPVAVAFMIERATGRNAFSIFGGVPQFTNVRGTRLRCQGAFSHAILAGSFWVSFVPLLVALWWRGGVDRRLAWVGGLSAMSIVVNCASSTPIVAVGVELAAAMMFPFRHYLPWVRRGVAGLLIMLHFTMNKPVWHLFARLDVISGSTGWHRYVLIETAVQHIDEWWLVGAPTTSHWRYNNYSVTDITNEYILNGLRGGMITMVLFLVVIVIAFSNVGRVLRRVERSRRHLILVWCVGTMLFTHCMIFFSVSYFGQTILAWYLALALAGSLPAIASPAAKQVVASRRQRARAGDSPRAIGMAKA